MSQVVPPTVSDRLMAVFRALIRAEDPVRDFRCAWEYVVVATDGTTADLSPSDPTIPLPQIPKVVMRAGLPGASVKPKVGALVYVVFANADPTRPYVIGYANPSAQSLTIDAGTGTLEHVATIEGVLNLLLAIAPMISPSTPLSDTLLAGYIATASSSTLGPLSATALATALASKRTAGGDGTPAALKPGLGCANIQTG